MSSNNNDTWRAVTRPQFETFLQDLAGWSASYRALAMSLSRRETNATFLLKKSINLLKDGEWLYAPTKEKVISESILKVVSCSVDRIFSETNAKYLAVISYLTEFNPSINLTISKLGGEFVFIAGDPVIIFPKGSEGIAEIYSYSDYHHSPVVGLVDKSSFESLTDSFFYIFDKESVMYVKTLDWK